MSKKVWSDYGCRPRDGCRFRGGCGGRRPFGGGFRRDRERVSKVFGTSSDLLAVTLDVTSAGRRRGRGTAAVDRFGRIDVLVNNAASFYAGYFEELTPEQIGQQLA